MALEIQSKESQSKVQAAVSETDETLNQEYIDERKVTISTVRNYSNYRRVNLKVLGQKKETIGSSIRSCQILSSNAGEVEAYFPALIGISANNPEFISRVKAWLSNIQVVLGDSVDKTLDTTFIYNKKSDYLKIKAEEDKIDEEYHKVNRNNIAAIKDALKKKLDAINMLESSKYKYGHPRNVEEYLIYRHCLLYKDVAKDPALINEDISIRFFIKDEAREAEREKKMIEERMRAMKAFIELNGTDSKFNAVFVAITLAKNDNLAEALLKDRNQKAAIIMDYVNNNPDKFNRLVADKNIKLKAFIETLIVRGELIRSDFNQQISTADGTFVGSNIKEAIAWFENPANKDVRTAFENKIKMV